MSCPSHSPRSVPCPHQRRAATARIHNLALNCCTQLADLYRNRETDTSINYMAKFGEGRGRAEDRAEDADSSPAFLGGCDGGKAPVMEWLDQ